MCRIYHIYGTSLKTKIAWKHKMAKLKIFCYEDMLVSITHFVLFRVFIFNTTFIQQLPYFSDSTHGYY